MATAPSPNDLTRQQLDELDTLLQRMLALPINGSEAAPPPAPDPVAAVPNWRVDPPAPAPIPVQQFVAPPLPVEPPRVRVPEPEPPAAAAPFDFTPTPPAVTVRAPQVRVRPEPPPAPVPVVPPPEPAAPVVERKPTPPPKVVAKKPEVVAAPAPVKPVVNTSGSAAEPRPPVPVMLWPFVALNWAVDSVLGLCGPPGWVLRSGFGKNLLGLVGIGLLAYTAAHVAGRQGWVTLPFPLPWPR
jgi:hypothetical protein